MIFDSFTHARVICNHKNGQTCKQPGKKRKEKKNHKPVFTIASYLFCSAIDRHRSSVFQVMRITSSNHFTVL